MKHDPRPPEGVEFHIPPLSRNSAASRATTYAKAKTYPKAKPAVGRVALRMLALCGIAYLISSASLATLLLAAGAIALFGAGLIYTATWGLDNIR